ncbi:MAG: hypothetical protein BZ136_09530 [Methanosphaera sp. rholeuAM74]|nr:MAG: hypothetical protein BZ136_09530 [Methanosphaera sp. rholeuAM74]
MFVELNLETLRFVINQLIKSDGTETTHEYQKNKGEYYIDNVAVIEKLEKQVLEQIRREHPDIELKDALKIYNPQYINPYKLFDQKKEEKTQLDAWF